MKSTEKLSRKKLISKLDKLVSQKIREIEPACVTCGSIDKLGAGHIFSRKAYATRWDLSPEGNVHTQCWGCNYRHVRDQYPYLDWYVKKYGGAKLESLRQRFHTITKLKDSHLLEMIERLKA